MHGEGVYTWPSGRVYTGYFENGVIVRTENDADEDKTEDKDEDKTETADKDE